MHSPQNSAAKQNGAIFGDNFEPHQAIYKKFGGYTKVHFKWKQQYLL